MKDPKLDHASMAERRESMLEAAYRLFTKRSITAVTLEEIAKEAGCGKKTLLRYYDSKPGLVIAVATLEWKRFLTENQKRRPTADFEGMTAAQIFEFYLDSFLNLYKNNRDLLRFNQFFNIYILSEEVEHGALNPYEEMIEGLKGPFHKMYEIAKRDHTIRTDISEEEMFLSTLHLMLAVVTRYAVGLVYQPKKGFDAEKELLIQKEALLSHYCTKR